MHHWEKIRAAQRSLVSQDEVSTEFATKLHAEILANKTQAITRALRRICDGVEGNRPGSPEPTDLLHFPVLSRGIDPNSNHPLACKASYVAVGMFLVMMLLNAVSRCKIGDLQTEAPWARAAGALVGGLMSDTMGRLLSFRLTVVSAGLAVLLPLVSTWERTNMYLVWFFRASATTAAMVLGAESIQAWRRQKILILAMAVWQLGTGLGIFLSNPQYLSLVLLGLPFLPANESYIWKNKRSWMRTVEEPLSQSERVYSKFVYFKHAYNYLFRSGNRTRREVMCLFMIAVVVNGMRLEETEQPSILGTSRTFLAFSMVPLYVFLAALADGSHPKLVLLCCFVVGAFVDFGIALSLGTAAEERPIADFPLAANCYQFLQMTTFVGPAATILALALETTHTRVRGLVLGLTFAGFHVGESMSLLLAACEFGPVIHCIRQCIIFLLLALVTKDYLPNSHVSVYVAPELHTIDTKLESRFAALGNESRGTKEGKRLYEYTKQSLVRNLQV